MTPPREYREIQLTQGQVAIVDPADYDWLSKYNWFAQRHPTSPDIFYAVRALTPSLDGRKGRISMHRQILGLKTGDPRIGDHRNPRRTLDNRRTNLRIVNHIQSQCNRRKMKNNTTGFKGVEWVPSRNKYRAHIVVNRKHYNLGYADTAEGAYEKFKAGALRLHGEYACLE